MANQALHLLDLSWRLHVEQGLNLCRVSFYSLMVDHKADELAQADAECALDRIQLYFVLSKNSKGLIQVFNVLLGFEAFHKYIVDVYFHGVSDLFFEHFVYKPLVGRTCILNTKRHNIIIE